MADPQNPLGSPLRAVGNGWLWFRSRALPLQIGAWALVAVAVAVIGLALEQRPPNQNAFSGLPDSGAAANGAAPTVVNQGGPGREGTDVQLPAGAVPTEVGGVSVAHFRATSTSVARLFNETLGHRGRAGLNSNQLLSATCTAAGVCSIKYVPDGPGAGRIIESQGPIWETLIKDPKWRAATITATVGGPDLAGRGGGPGGHAHGGPPGVVLSCTRQAVAQIPVWGIEAAPKIQALCQFGKVELKGA
jgi:hypothetical protein